MKINSIIDRYIFSELIGPFVLCSLFLIFVFLMKLILEVTNFIVNYGVSLLSVILLLIYSIPYFLQFIIPMSVMMSVLLTFLRMSGDNEIVALKAGGLSIYRLFPSVVLFCIIGYILTSFMTIYGLPWGKISFKKLTWKLAASHIDIGLKERTFNDGFKDVMLYVNKIDMGSKELKDVFVEDLRSEESVSTIVAPSGKMYSEPNKLLFHLRLYNGLINQVDIKTKSVHTINFDTYDINLDLKKSVPAYSEKDFRKGKEEMSFSELRNFIKEKSAEKDTKYYAALMKLHEKFSLPFACIVLGLIGVPIGIQSRSDKRSVGIILGLFLFLFYYIMLLTGWSLGESGTYPPAVGMWMPNIVMAGLGLYFLKRTANDRPFVFDFYSGFIRVFKFRK